MSRIARCEAPGLGVVEGVGGTHGVDAGPPQHLVAEQVAEPGDARLVHEHGLDRRSAPGDDRPQLGQRQVERVGTEAVFVGIELHRAQPARVAQVEAAAVGERASPKRCHADSGRLLA